MVKVYKHNRISSINSTLLSIKDVIRRLPLKDIKREKITLANLKATWPISEQQYISLFETKPYYSSKLGFIKINSIWDRSNYRLPNAWKFIGSILMYHPSNIKTTKLYHNFTCIESIINFKEKKDIGFTTISYDDEILLKSNQLGSNKFVKPDWTLVKDDSIYFIEADMWTETYSKLKEKDENYIDIVAWLKKSWDFKNIKIILYTTVKRWINLNKAWVFSNLEKYNLIEYHQIS